MTPTKHTQVEFTGGGPLDGEQCAVDDPPDEWYAAAGGRYEAVAWPLSTPGARRPIALYEWVPNNDG